MGVSLSKTIVLRVISTMAFVAVAVVIFALTAMSAEDTSSMSNVVSDSVKASTGVTQVVVQPDTTPDPWTAFMAQVTNVRKWAHTVEFGVLGLAAFWMMWSWLCGVGRGGARWGSAAERDGAGRGVADGFQSSASMGKQTAVPSRAGTHRAAIWAVVICAAYSLFDQTHKLFVPGREFDPTDLVFDAIGYVLAIGVALLVSRRLIRRSRR